ncbi:MAG: hypothetical protein NVS3B20_05940 [Polyangiales bacterium]
MAMAAWVATSSRVNGSPVTLDRTVARFSDPEAAEASASLRFVMMRELVIEAWLVSFEKNQLSAPTGFDERDLRQALERHVIETVLGDRVLTPAVEKKVEGAAKNAWEVQAILVGGAPRLAQAIGLATFGGVVSSTDLDTILRRRARAELYLETAVLQPVRPSEPELRAAQLKAPKVLAEIPFQEATPRLTEYVRSVRLRETSQSYYQAVRARLHIEIVAN